MIQDCQTTWIQLTLLEKLFNRTLLGKRNKQKSAPTFFIIFTSGCISFREVSSNHIIAHYMESHQPNTAYIVLYVNVTMYIYNIIYNMIWVINHLLHLGPAEAGKWVHIFKHDYDRRKFRSQTFRQYGQMKSRAGQRQRERKIRREKIRRERVRRKKMQMREKVGKSRNTVFFQWFVAPEGRKVGSLKRRVRSQLATGAMKNCTPLWCEAHFEVKSVKNWRSRTTFGSWDVEKSARRCGAKHISKSECTNTSASDHFWKLRCRKSARRCGEKHISKWKCTKHTRSRTTFGSCDVEKVHAVVARSTFPKSKCTKHTILGPLLEVEMSKKCTPLWREAHFQVKMFKTHHSRTTFGSWEVEKVHAVVARSTFPSQKCKKLRV